MTMMSNNIGQCGDTTLTKVFVGGLAWETPMEAMREHFDKYGEILEAVIISDKVTGKSKGYGFVTFKEVEAAKKACEDATPIINGRRANCNLASLGARRPRSVSTTLPHQGSNGGAKPAPANQVQYWYYPAGRTPPSTPFHHHHRPAVPFYGYSPSYNIATDISYNHELSSYGGGNYMMNGRFPQVVVYPHAQPMVGGNTLMPMYPFYYNYHQSQTTGLPAHIFTTPSAAGSMMNRTAVPAIISKPAAIGPNVTGTVGAGDESFKKVVLD